MKQRKHRFKLAVDIQHQSSINRLNIIVISISTFYIIILLPWLSIGLVWNNLDFLPSHMKYIIDIFYYLISNYGIVFLRTFDVIILVLMVKDYWSLLYCKFLQFVYVSNNSFL